MESFKQEVRNGRVKLGMQCFSGSSFLVEIIGYTGFDFVVIDMEHSPISIAEVVHLIRSSEAVGIAAFVRVPEIDRALTTLLLDAGADGIVFPAVESPKDAEKAVGYTKFPTAGKRGCCPFTRASKYSLKGWTSYWKKANDSIMTCLLIEGKEGIANLEDICSVPGIDSISIGRFDLAQSIGQEGNVDHPAIKHALASAIMSCKKHGIAPWCASFSKDSVQELINMGVTMINYAPDSFVFSEACHSIKSFFDAALALKNPRHEQQ
jgi:4-hydroxy-2-oxoheptanedioate aldolase